MAVKPGPRPYANPLYESLLSTPGLSVAAGSLDELLTWGATNSLWVFPMATSCCGIEFMAAAASRVDLDRMGTIVRATPRQADVMVVAGTITVKMAPRVKKLWDQMPEPKWCVAMGSCAISGDFYRDLYPVVPGIDTFLPVDVYIPGCPPSPEALMQGLLMLQEKIKLIAQGKWIAPEPRPETAKLNRPAVKRLTDSDRDESRSGQQVDAAMVAGQEADLRLVVEPLHLPVLNGKNGHGDSSLIDADEVTTLVRERFGIENFVEQPTALVDAMHVVELATVLKQAGYQLLSYVVASHWPAPPESADSDYYEVAYGLRSIGPRSRLAGFRVRVPVGEAVDSLTPVFAGADWQEREQYDLVGVKFRGHPDLRRILLPGDWQGHPLKRDYPSNAECPPWR